VKTNLIAAQRTILFLVTGAARTTSTAAMQTIAGIKPLDLAIKERGLKSRINKNWTAKWRNYSFTEGSLENSNVEEEYQKIETEIKQKWQQEWTENSHGRLTYSFIPDILFSRRNKWFTPSRKCVYLITGYGPINDTLFKRGLKDNDKCPICKDKIETVAHMVLECEGYQGLRYEELKQDTEIGITQIETKEKFRKFNNFATNLYKIRDTHL